MNLKEILGDLFEGASIELFDEEMADLQTYTNKTIAIRSKTLKSTESGGLVSRYSIIGILRFRSNTVDASALNRALMMDLNHKWVKRDKALAKKFEKLFNISPEDLDRVETTTANITGPTVDDINARLYELDLNAEIDFEGKKKVLRYTGTLSKGSPKQKGKNAA